MSTHKRKRYTDNSTTEMDPNALQAVVLNPVVEHTKQLVENSQLQLLSGASNVIANQTNPSYFILPPDVNTIGSAQTVLQSIPVYLLVPREQSDKLLEKMTADSGYSLPNIKLPIKRIKKQNDVIMIKDVRTIKSEEEENAKYPESNPLEIVDISSIKVENSNEFKVNKIITNPLYKCDLPNCNAVFPSAYEKKIHKDVHQFPPNTEFKCSICNMIFKCAIERNKHVESHSVAHTYKCGICNASFPYFTSLVQHINSQCNEDTSSKSNKIVHVKCNYCDVKFIEGSDLIRHHKRIHHREFKSYKPSNKSDHNKSSKLILKPLINRRKVATGSEDVIVLD